MSQMRIFLSHSSQDKPFADALVRALRGAEADVWYDEHNLGAGVLRREIMRELADRPVFVVVVSKAALQSDWVQDECEWAYNLTKREPNRLMVPVVATAYDPSDFNTLLYLESLKRVEGPGHQPYPPAEAIERALRLLGLTPAGQAPTPAMPQPSESADDLVTRAKALVAQEEYAEAIPHLERATQREPGNFDAWFNLAYARGELGRWIEALAAIERALAIKPNDVTARVNKGAELNNLGRFVEALVTYDHALALDPEFPTAWGSKGKTLYNQGRFVEALAAYDRAIALEPTARRWRNRAATLRALGRNAEAQEAERRANELGG